MVLIIFHYFGFDIFKYFLEFQRKQAGNALKPVKPPKSPWISFPTLISILSEILPPKKSSEIVKCHNEFRVQFNFPFAFDGILSILYATKFPWFWFGFCVIWTQAKKIRRMQLVQKVRTIAGDKLLDAVIKSINNIRKKS